MIRRNEMEPRTKKISIRISENDYHMLESFGVDNGLSASTALRYAAMNYIREWYDRRA